MSAKKPVENKEKKSKKGKNLGGRPTLFTKAHIRQAFAFGLHGGEWEKLTEFWGITPKTLKSWKEAHPEVFSAFVRGKKESPPNAALALYRRACGYKIKSEKVFADPKSGKVIKVPYTEHVLPDVKAIELFLTNRSPKQWKKRVDVSHEVSESLANRLGAARQRAKKETP